MYLDIEKISDLFLGVGDDGKGLDKDKRYDMIATEVDDCKNDSKNVLQKPLKECQENLLFWAGEQYIEYDNTINQYQPIEDNQFTDYIPQPKDNLLEPVTNTMVSMLTQNKPTADVIQNSDSSQDRNRAKLAGAIQSAKWEIDREQANYRMAAKIGTICKNVYRKDYWDTSGFQTVRVNIKNDDGTVDVMEAPLGDNKVKILTPFEIIPDIKNAKHDLDDGRFILEIQVLPIKEINNVFGKKGNGYTGRGKDVKASEEEAIIQTYLDKLKEEDSGSLENYAVVIEGYTRPTPNVKKGLKFVVCNKMLLYIKESPYTEDDGTNWHPYTMWRYNENPVSHYGKALLDDLVPIQKRYNSILALQALNRETMAIPQWLVPDGSLPVDGYITGEPGLNIECSVVNGMMPTKVPGIGLDNSVYKEQEMCEQKISKISGDNQVMQGVRPEGVNTAAMYSMMLEQATTVHAPKTQAWEEFLKRSQSKKLNLLRRGYQEPRSSLINRVKALNADNREVEIDDLFTGQMLGNNIDVNIEAGSYLPRLKSAQRMNLLEVYGQGLLGDLSPMANPIGNKELLKKIGVEQFSTANSPDVTKAKWENDVMRQGKDEKLKALPIDNPLIHIKTIIDEVNRPEFFDSHSAEVIALFNEHAMQHWDMLDEQQKAMVNGGLSPNQIVKIEESRNIYGLGLNQAPQPSVEERLNMLEGRADQTEMIIDEAGKLISMGATPAGQETMLSPQSGSPDMGVAPNNIPPQGGGGM